MPLTIMIIMEGDHLKPSIGFIGMGHMGSHMALKLLKSGYHLTVYDRTREKAHEIGQQGAHIAKTPRDLAAGCQVVMASVTDDRAQQEVMLGPDGALAGIHNGSIIIDLSTVSPDASYRLFQAAKEKNVSMIDAPVSGSVPQVDEGSLLIFVGGERTTLEHCKSILDVLGKNIFYMGASGMGTTMKLVVNTLLGLGMQAIAEAITLGEKAGLDKRLLLEVLGETTVLTPSQKSKLENVKLEKYPTNFALSLMHKDFSLVLNRAYDLSVSMPATAAAQQIQTAAIANEMDGDFSIIVQFMEKLAGLSTISEEQKNKQN
jgi:3-hydroxyisobutyrate dehydrogenase-like beta-hydroxyacid dehydrogenase